MFVWYSAFNANYVGVSNYCGGSGAGNFRVYNSVFQNSTASDLKVVNAGLFSAENNYSSGSNAFVVSAASGNTTNWTISGNTILDTTQSLAVNDHDMGPLVFVDNVVRSLAGATTPIVYSGGFGNPPTPTDLFSMNNTFSINALGCSTDGSTVLRDPTGHCHSIGDQYVARGSINPSPPTLPGPPPNNNRQTFEASPIGSGTACTEASPCSVQQAITNAANAEQSRAIHPVAHIAAGTYNITATITVPATVNSGIQIVGDGGYSQFNWTNTSSAGPAMRLLGPSKVILRDFFVNGNSNTGNGIEIDNADQAGSRVFIEQAVLGSNFTNFFVDALDYTNVELHDFYHQYDSTPGMTSVIVNGGPSAAAGLWQGGATNVFAGASSGNDTSYSVSNGAHVGIRDVWYDASLASRIANIIGTSTFTYAGSLLALAAGSPLAISLNNFQGTAALVNLYTNGNIDITGDSGTGKVLGLGLVGPSTTFFNSTSSPAATAFLNGQTTADPPTGRASSQLPGQPTSPEPAFLTETLHQMRTTQPTLLAPLSNGVTDARFYRVFVGSAKIGIHLRASATP